MRCPASPAKRGSNRLKQELQGQALRPDRAKSGHSAEHHNSKIASPPRGRLWVCGHGAAKCYKSVRGAETAGCFCMSKCENWLPQINMNKKFCPSLGHPLSYGVMREQTSRAEQLLPRHCVAIYK